MLTTPQLHLTRQLPLPPGVAASTNDIANVPTTAIDDATLEIFTLITLPAHASFGMFLEEHTAFILLGARLVEMLA